MLSFINRYRMPALWATRRQRWAAAGLAAGLAGLAALAAWLAQRPTPLAGLVPWPALSGAALIFALRLTDVPIGTVKTMMMVRGMRGWATALSFAEVTLWLLAISRVMGQLDNVWNIIGYAAGYAAGTWLGMWLEGRLAFGNVEVHTISLTRSDAVAEAIRAGGFGATQFQAFGQSGPVCMVRVITARRRLQPLLDHIRAVDPDAFVTVDDTRHVTGGRAVSK